MPRSAVLLVLLGIVLSANCSLSPPRISFLLNSGNRPLVHFSLPNLQNTTELLLSNDGSTLFVGAQNTILSLNVDQSGAISLKKKVQWSPSNEDVTECSSKGKNPLVDCPNFIHVLQPLNSTHLYTCGSYAYSPQEAYIDTESFSIVQQSVAKGRCPFSPFERSTAVIIDGELFTATATDFRGLKPQISRYFTKDGPDINLETSISLLEGPTFVSSSLDPAEGKLYFFFSEVGKEFSYVDELKTARVAQVCKDDVGGQRTLQKKWTSFAKAALLCQSQKQLPFNILQDMFTLQPPEGSTNDILFYGVFTSQWSRAPESAVCVFKLQDIKEVFKGSYRTFIMESHQWSPIQESYSYLGMCGLHNSTDAVLGEVKRSFLTKTPVTPARGSPVVVSSGEQYSRVAVMRTQAANGKHYTILFLITESGFLHKVALFDQGPWVIEEIQVVAWPQPIKSIVLSSSKGVLYVGTSEGVTAVPVANCSTYSTCSQCLLARDPLCGWSQTGRVCTLLDGTHKDMVQILEDGDVKEKCQGQTEASKSTEVSAHLNEVVTLSCLKPSNLATLNWTSSKFKNQSENRFIQSADGNLSFFVTDDTLGNYSCEAEEGGYKEEIKRYDVQLKRPRNFSPRTRQSVSTEEPDENIATEEPTMFVTQREHTSTYSTNDRNNGFTTTFKDNNKEVHEKKVDQTLTSVRDSQYSPEPTLKEKSYYSELVAVSLLLALCICILILGSLHVWRQGKVGLKRDPLVTPDESSNTNKAAEICSLSSPEEAEPEVKVAA